jgi:ABC-type multidrug transport system fused ATPase/permease subunit
MQFLDPFIKVWHITLNTLKLFWPQFKLTFILQSGLLFIINLFGFIQPALLGLVINELTQNPQFNSQLNLLLLLLVLSSILPSFLYTLQGYIGRINYLKLEQIMELEYFRLNTKLDIPHYEDPEIKNLINRVNEESRWRMRNFIDRIVYTLGDLFSLLIASLIVFQASWWALPILLLATLPELIISNRYGGKVWSISVSQSEERRIVWEIRNHYTYLSGLMEIRLFQNISHFYHQISSLYNKFISQQIKNEKKRASQLIAAQGVSQFTTALIALFFIFQVIEGNLLIGTLTFLIASIGKFRESLSGLLYQLSSQYEDSLFIADFLKLKSLKPTIKSTKNSFHLQPQHTPLIEFQDVSFTYPHQKTPVLNHINLTLAPGTRLALVGSNGAGKTTLIKLLCRFYDPTQGQILINGHNLKSINLDSWYQLLGILSQEYAHFRMPVKESIHLGNTKAPFNFDKVIAAAKKATAHSFILNWPQQYDQQLGRDFTNGIEPSLGQWQKLALARLFYRNPRLYILDEPTSSLDPRAEAEVFNQLTHLDHHHTSIFISHRFNTVKKATSIAVLENGFITELGTHQELMKKTGTYAQLFSLQAQEYQ